jgi:hypothetical protein
MPMQVRRVIAGHDAEGKAVILTDGSSPAIRNRPVSGTTSNLMWVLDQLPADLKSFVDMADGAVVPTCPPKTGVYFRVSEFPPEPEMTEELNKALVEELTREGSQQPRIQRRPEHRHPGMHRTESVDFAIILRGEIDMLVDEDEVHLNQGDVLIQLGNNHAWVNRSGAPCLIAFVLLGAEVGWA